MLPIILLEIFYKVMWLAIVAYPLWARGTLAGSAAEGTTAAFLWVLLPIVVVPWGYVWRTYGYDPRLRSQAQIGAQERAVAGFIEGAGGEQVVVHVPVWQPAAPGLARCPGCVGTPEPAAYTISEEVHRPAAGAMAVLSGVRLCSSCLAYRSRHVSEIVDVLPLLGLTATAVAESKMAWAGASTTTAKGRGFSPLALVLNIS